MLPIIVMSSTRFRPYLSLSDPIRGEMNLTKNRQKVQSYYSGSTGKHTIEVP